MRAIQNALAGSLALLLVACGGGGGGGGATTAPAATYTVSGTITGLIQGRTVVLADNGATPKNFTASGTYTYTGAIPTGTAYAITVQTQPIGQTCTVSHGSGTIGSANVVNVAVSCTANPYTVSVTATNLAGGQTVMVQDNGGDNLNITANGTLNTFATPVNSGSSYAVTVGTQPTGQHCAITNGSGTIVAANVVNVVVNCNNQYSVGGHIFGLLPGTSVVLVNNNASPATFTANGLQTFTGAISTGTTYDITVQTQPLGQTCTVNNASGTIGGANVANVVVGCTGNPYTVSVTASGLASGQTVVLQNNGGDNLSIAANGTLTPFATAVTSGRSYAVTVHTQPSGQNCAIGSGSGQIAAANVVNVIVDCNNQYNVGVTLTGLPFGSSITLQNSGDNLTLLTNETANFATPLSLNQSYSVSISSQAPNQTCNFASGSNTGTITANVTIAIDCPHFAYVTNHADSSVSIYSINNTTGVLTEQTAFSPVTGGATTPYGIALSPDLSFVYVVGGGVFGYSSDPATGALSALNGGVGYTAGNTPWTIAFNPLGTYAYVANFAGNTVSEFTADPIGGALTGPTASPSTGSLPFTVTVAPNGRFAYVANSNQGAGGNSISVYSIDGSGALSEISGSPFTVDPNSADSEVTPAITIDPTSSFAFVVGNNTQRLYILAIGSDGSLSPVSGSPFTAGGNPSWAAVHPNGQFAYVANFGSPTSTVSMYSYALGTGLWTVQGTAPSGDGSETITVDPTGNYAYVVNQQDNTVSTFLIDQTTGVLTPTGSPVSTGVWPEMMVIR
jgi:6-phosphogluconolactonase (cycloisomerase 2 family)